MWFCLLFSVTVCKLKKGRVYALFCAGVIHLTVVQHSTRYVVSQTPTADIDETVGFHRTVTAARHQHVGLRLPRLRACVITLEEIQSRASYQHTHTSTVYKWCLYLRKRRHTTRLFLLEDLFQAQTHPLQILLRCRSFLWRRRRPDCLVDWGVRV